MNEAYPLGALRFFEEVVSFKIRRTFGFADYRWGHKVLPGESFTNDITKAQGDSILRADMMKLCRLFSRFGRDSTLLSCLAYQVGPYRLLGSKDFPKSKLIQKLEAGNRDIYKEYISFRCYKGKVVPSIERRRKVEYLLLFEE